MQWNKTINLFSHFYFNTRKHSKSHFTCDCLTYTHPTHTPQLLIWGRCCNMRSFVTSYDKYFPQYIREKTASYLSFFTFFLITVTTNTQLLQLLGHFHLNLLLSNSYDIVKTGLMLFSTKWTQNCTRSECKCHDVVTGSGQQRAHRCCQI